MPENTQNTQPPTHLNYEERLRRRRRTIKLFESKFRKNRSFVEKLADFITSIMGSIAFAVLHVFWFILWITVNTGMVPGLLPFDPFPFGLLTMIVSLEAIFLSIFVLISQNRQAQIDNLREEVHLQVNMIAEEEITKVMHMVHGLYKGLKIKEQLDPELEQMMKPLNTADIERRLEEQMKKDQTLLDTIKEILPGISNGNNK